MKLILKTLKEAFRQCENDDFLQSPQSDRQGLED